MIKVSKNVLRDSAACLTGEALLSTERGSLFAGPKDLPVACIRLALPVATYFQYLDHLPTVNRPDPLTVVPVDGQPYDIVICGEVEIEGGTVKVNGRQVVLL